MEEPARDRLNAWRQHWRRSYGYLGAIRRARARGLWPARVDRLPDFAGARVLVARHDRFGDMMLTLPFLARVLAAGADLRVLARNRLARQLLDRVPVPSVAAPDGLGDWQPDWLLFAAPARHLRSGRHPERWVFVEEMLAHFRGTPSAMPVMRRGEALSVFPGCYCSPLSGISATGLLERFADGLGLPAAERPLLHAWIRDPETRAAGAVVLNLSAGAAGESDRRDLPVRFWSRVAQRLSEQGHRLACIVQPGDDALREDAASDPVLAKGEIACFDDVGDAAQWLGGQRLLVSPETGLCHLARNLRLPMVVLTPPRKVPYFYPLEPGVGFVFAKSLQHIRPEEVVATALRELA